MFSLEPHVQAKNNLRTFYFKSDVQGLICMNGVASASIIDQRRIREAHCTKATNRERKSLPA